MKIDKFFNDLREFLEIAGIELPSYSEYWSYRLNSIENLEETIEKLFLKKEVVKLIEEFRDILGLKDNDLAKSYWRSSLNWERDSDKFIEHYRNVLTDIFSAKEKKLIFTKEEEEIKKKVENLLTDNKNLREINNLKVNLEEFSNSITSNSDFFRIKKARFAFDALARFLTGKHQRDKTKKDTCVAICYHNNKLFVASNKKKPEYAKECLFFLREFISNHSVENFEKLLKKSVEKIHHINLLENDRMGEFVDDSERVILNEFSKKIEECHKKDNPDWESLQNLANKLFNILQKMPDGSKKKSKIWKLLTPWHDIGEVIKFVVDDELKEITELISQEENLIYVESEDEESNPEQNKTHAELKIINRLYYKKRDKEEKQESRYIGSSKKTCAHCQATIDTFNDGKYQWVSYGTHGGGEFKCKTPKLVIENNKENEVESLTKKLTEEAKKNQLSSTHTTSQIPKELFNSIKLLVETQNKENFHSSIQTPSK